MYFLQFKNKSFLVANKMLILIVNTQSGKKCMDSYINYNILDINDQYDMENMQYYAE